MKGRFPKTLIESEYNRMPTNVDLTKYTSPKKYGIYLQEKKHKRKGSGDYGNLQKCKAFVLD